MGTPSPTTSSPVSQPSATTAPSSSYTTNSTSFEEVFFNDFEAPDKWGNFYKGGNHAARYKGGKHAYSGDAAIRIRNGDGKNSAIISNEFDVSEYAVVNVHFIFKPLGVEAGEALALEYSVDGGANYYTENTWRKGVDFENGSFYGMTEDIIVKPDDENMKIRFIALGDQNNDKTIGPMMQSKYRSLEQTQT